MRDPIQTQIVDLLAAELSLAPEEVAAQVRPPAKPDMGDYAFPCFLLSKKLRQAPPAIAQQLAQSLKPQLDEYGLEKIEAVGPYLNFFVKTATRAEAVVSLVLETSNRYGTANHGMGKTIVIDYSSPNIAKPFSIGHLRSTNIGNALANIFMFLGYKVERINHLGDWGTQFGKNIAAYLRWQDEIDLAGDKPVEQLYQLYARFNQAAEQQPELDDEARAWFNRLEQGDETALELWEKFREVSLSEFQRIYDILGVRFDSFAGESFYRDRLEDTVARVVAQGLATESEGALIVEMEPAPLMLRKSDGSTTYATRDLAAAFYRHETYQFEQAFYVTGNPQKLHFQQVFETLLRMGCDWANQCQFVGFGHIGFPDGAMSTRKGNIIFLEEVLDKAIEKTKAIMEEKNPDLSDKDTVACQVGVGAIIFNDLWRRRMKDFVFQWDEVLNFDGNSGPYVQYAHARLCSILRKQNEQFGAWSPHDSRIDYALLEAETEKLLIADLSRFPVVVQRAADDLEPSLIANYLVELAEAANSFHKHQRVLVPEEPVRNVRLALCWATKQVLANGMRLLGMVPVEAM